MTKFERNCRKAAEQLGYNGENFHFSQTERKGEGAFEDDGTLHIVKKGQWVYFSIGQDYPAETWNEKVTAILTALSLERLLGEKCLQEPEANEDDECPTAGGATNARH